MLFSNKGQCVRVYNKLMDEESVVAPATGDIVEIVDPGIKSALTLMSDIPGLYDLIYELLPSAYNAVGKFGKIEGVKGSTTGTPKYKTPFYKRPVPYKFGEGYIYPLVCGLSALMKSEDGKVKWITDPHRFVKAHLHGIVRSYYSMIQGLNYDPVKVGKAKGAYNLAVDMYTAAYKGELLEQAGII